MKKIMFLLMLVFFESFVYSNELINLKLDEQDLLLDDLEKEFNDVKLLVSTLEINNSNLANYAKTLELRVNFCNQKINELQTNIDSTKKALLSNKEDTSEIISVLGEMQDELNNYKIYVFNLEQKINRSNKFVQITIPITSLLLISNGIYLYCFDEKECGKFCIISGTVFFCGAELIWNGGKFILKLW